MKKKRPVSKKKISNSKLLFLSVVLLLIVFEALYIQKSYRPGTSQVAGISTSR